MTISRRHFLRSAGLGLAGWPLLAPLPAMAQTTAATTAPAALPPLNRFPRMMQGWLVEEVRAAERVGDTLRDAVRTKADAEAYVQSARERIARAFGPLPEKTPLNAKVTRVVEREGYRIECVIFESRPGYLVTGNLYVPTGRKGPMPGVVGTCGHSLNGKAAEPYQAFAQNLARLGSVCLLFDPVGQGERIQFPAGGGKSRLGGSSVAEHIQLGNQQTLIGEFLGTWFAWDGIRALGYLLTRPEVDPRHLGITGNSGGGTQTTWLCGLEPRFTMAAPACFVTTFRRNAENELPADTEQCPPRALALGLDHSDFLAAMAPNPVIILTQEKDFFDARGALVAYDRLKRLYTTLGQPENIQLQLGPDPHGYSQPNREAMYRFFNKVTGGPAVPAEPGLTVEKDETLWCTPNGQVANAGARTLIAFTRDKAGALSSSRPSFAPDELRKAVRELLKLSAPDTTPPDYRILRGIGNRRYPTKEYCTYVVETEPRIQALLTRLSSEPLTSRLPASASPAILYVSHLSADTELREEPLVREIIAAAPSAAFYACDVRGSGESQPNTCGADQFLKPYGSHYFYAAHSLMLDRPLLGQRTFDVLRVLQLLVRAGHKEIHLAGAGWGALPAAFAALLAESVQQVTLKHALTSYHEIALAEAYDWPLATLLPDVLTKFDLPDCYRALAAKKLRQIEPWGAQPPRI